jgi:DNA polymerase-3 subunit epsilon
MIAAPDMPSRLGRTHRRLPPLADPWRDHDLRSLPVVAVDLETTGGSPVTSRIVEVAAVRYEDGREVAAVEDLIDPLIPIPPEATAIHGITDGMVRGRPRLEDLLPDLLRFLEGAVLLAHHAPFDFGFLAYEVSKRPQRPPANPILCTCRLPRRLFKGLGSYSLESLCGHFGIARARKHRAGDDARACREVFARCVERLLEEEPASRWQELVQRYGPPLRLEDFFTPWPEGPTLKEIRRALRRSRPLRIVYALPTGLETERWITPLAVGQYRGAVQVEAFCHAVGERRTFRLDRMLEVGSAPVG